MTDTQKRWLDFPAIFTLSAALLLVAARLSATQWTADLSRVITITFIGLIFGAALGYSRFTPGRVTLFALVYTVFFLGWQLGSTIGSGDVLWRERIFSLGGRFGLALGQFLRNQPVNDPLLFLGIMGLLFWIIAITGGYQLVRYGKPWQSLVIAAITLVIVDLYSPSAPRSNFYSGAFLVLSLLLLAQVNYMRSRERWQADGVAVESDTEFSLGRGALIVGLVLVLLAWNIPTAVLAMNPGTIEQRNLSETFRQLRQRFENATASLSGPLKMEQDFFGDELGLGTGSPLSDDIVFTVESSVGNPPPGTVYYWRGRTYDFYDQQKGWLSTIEETSELAANSDPLPYPEWGERIRTRFSFHTQKNLGILYAPSVPLIASRDSQAITNPAGADQLDLIALIPKEPVRGGETYEVTSWISNPSINSMRAAGANYPDWVMNKYLQLPSDFSPRIRALAEEITAGLDNPYDQATAITGWLRQNIEYQASIEAPPANADPLEYFLFDYKKGFCNYYASAEVTMLRAIGIPARMAVGYAPGVFNTENENFEVRRKQFHAWPEVYFEGIGWVEFEPTVSQVNIARLTGMEAGSASTDTEDLPDKRRGPGPLEDDGRDNEIEDLELLPDAPPVPIWARIPWPLMILAFAALTVSIFFVWYAFKRRANAIEPLPVLLESGMRTRGWHTPRWIQRWAHLARLDAMERAFLTVEWVMALLRKPLAPAATPSEAVAALSRALPAAAAPADALLTEYQRALYSPYPADLDKARQASSQVWREWLRYSFSRLMGNAPTDDYDYS